MLEILHTLGAVDPTHATCVGIVPISCEYLPRTAYPADFSGPA